MKALLDILAERARQDAKHGPGLPSGGMGPMPGLSELAAVQRTQKRCDDAARAGQCTMRLVLEEEIAEVFAERPGSARQREELVQVAAVAVKWIEAIDAAAGAARTEERSREWLIARLVGVGVELTDEALARLVLVAEVTHGIAANRRDLSSEALMRMQRAREQP